MSAGADMVVRCADGADAGDVGRLLHDFNAEFDEPTPGPEAVAERVRALYESLGFSNRDGEGTGPVNYFYEREL